MTMPFDRSRRAGPVGSDPGPDRPFEAARYSTTPSSRATTEAAATNTPRMRTGRTKALPDNAVGDPVISGEAFVGRDEELATVRAALERGGCVLGGLAGVGKSRLASEAAGGAGDRTVLRVLATASARTVPFGALGHLIGDSPSPGGSVIRDFIEDLRRDESSAPPTLVVDDAHLLDDASAALILAVAMAGVARLLVTVRSFEFTPDAIVALWKDRYLERVDLQPLSRADVRRLVDDLLGGPAHALLHERLYELSHGNPLFVRELVADGRRTGALVAREGRWHQDGDGWGLGRLRDVIWSRIEALSPAARHAMEILAVGAPLRLADLERLAPSDAVEELERSGLAVVRADPQHLVVDVVHPLHGELVAAATPATVARHVRRKLALVLAAHEHDTTADALRIATWLLEAGEADPDRFLVASAHALRRGAPHLAERLAAASGEGLEPALRLAQARIGLSQFEAVEPLLAPWERAAAAAPPAVRADYVEARSRAALRGDLAEEAFTEFLERAAGWDDDRDWQALIATQRAWYAIYERRPLTAGRLLAPHIDDARVSPIRRFYLLTAAVWGSEQSGIVAECESLCARLRDLLAAGEAMPWEAQLLAVEVDTYPRRQAGRDLDDMAQRADDARTAAEAAGNLPLAGAMVNLSGIVALMRGHAADAVRLLSDATDRVTHADQLNSADWVMSSLAQAHALAGNVGEASRVLASIEDRVGRRSRHAVRIEPTLQVTRAAIEGASGYVSAARQRLLAVAANAGEELGRGAAALHAAVRLGADAAACRDRLRMLAAATGNELVGLYADQASGVASGDPHALLAVAQAFDERGLDLFAAEAAARAAAAYGHRGLHGGAHRAGALAARCARRCQGAISPTLTMVTDAASLTAREREVSGLAARGLTNAEIAGELVLSVRSVETYLLRSCRKLGARNRRELTALLDASGRVGAGADGL